MSDIDPSTILPGGTQLSSVESRRRAACYAHASQAPDKFYALQSQVSRFRGIESGYSQAEAFIRQPCKTPCQLIGL